MYLWHIDLVNMSRLDLNSISIGFPVPVGRSLIPSLGELVPEGLPPPLTCAPVDLTSHTCGIKPGHLFWSQPWLLSYQTLNSVAKKMLSGRADQVTQ